MQDMLEGAVHEDLVRKQAGLCAICGNPETKVVYGKVQRLSVDHDHATGEVRGLLCNSCNALLGMAGDSVGVLHAAIDYLLRKA